MSPRQDESTLRLTGLAFALLGAAQSGGSPDRSSEWIRRNVAGYNQDSDEAFHKMLNRDVAALRRAGVPIVSTSTAGSVDTPNGGVAYRLEAETYFLPEVEFTREETMALAAASGLGTSGGITGFAQNGWTKLAASGASRNTGGAPAFHSINDISRVDPDVFHFLMVAIDARVRITFQYQPTPTAEPVKRRMDPWGVVTRQGWVYLVGWDIDRQAPRSFRILNISDIRRSRDEATHAQPTMPLDEVLDQVLSVRDVVDAAVRIPLGVAEEFASHGVRRAGEDSEVVDFSGVSQDWLVRTVVGFAAEVEVLGPPELRAAVKDYLDTLVSPAGKGEK